jgi:REP element-mobilizing transposase RayT
MAKKFKNKYRIGSTRLQSWDYGSNAKYFVTIVLKDRKRFFGQVRNGKMDLSPIGEIADKFWREIPEHFPFVILHNHIVMPDHIHGIIEIAKPNGIETQNFASQFQQNKFGPPVKKFGIHNQRF